MISLLREIIMPDELPSGDKAVYIFIEMIALGFVLYAIEEAFKDIPSWPKVAVAVGCGVISFFVGIKWATLKQRLATGFAKRIDAVASDYRYRYGLPLLVVGVIAAYGIIYLRSVRNELDAYMWQRHVTSQQSERLKDYLSKRPAASVTIRVVRHDSEAMSYAAQLFFAMTQTNWDIDPPNHSGPDYVTLQPYVQRPKISDYKTYAEYANAHDDWIESEIRRSADQNFDETPGLCVNVDLPGQPVNPDPRHPTPDAILRDAMQYAGIEVNCGGGGYNRAQYMLTLLVGHRPSPPPPQRLRDKVRQWFESFTGLLT